MAKFTSALKIKNGQDEGWHITLCFCEASKAGKVSTLNGSGLATVVDVIYWEHCDLTVMIVDCPIAMDRHEYYKESGYTYDHEFIPHVTIGRGDITKEWIFMKGEKLIAGDEYVRIF